MFVAWCFPGCLVVKLDSSREVELLKVLRGVRADHPDLAVVAIAEHSTVKAVEETEKQGGLTRFSQHSRLGGSSCSNHKVVLGLLKAGGAA